MGWKMLKKIRLYLFRRRYRAWRDSIRPLRGLQAKMTFRDYVDMVWAQRIKLQKSIYYGYGSERTLTGIEDWLRA